MMTAVYILTPELRLKLKEPFGNLIQGTAEETMAKINELIKKQKPSRIISVGDVVSLNLHRYGIEPQLTIIDNVSLRDKAMPQDAVVEKTVYVDNPQGTIAPEAILAIKKAMEEKGHTHIVVKGEEDLLTLIAVLFAPENSFVVYGQPYSGVVVVKVTLERKARAQEFLNIMKVSKS
jgi:uncharacterized protein (UPF0218 family)